MHALRCGLLAFAIIAVPGAQAIEPPLSDSRLTVHTLVREDVFAGFMSNDLTRFARAERNIEALLEQRPSRRGNLLAWKGSTRLYRAVLAHEAGNAADARKLYNEARALFADATATTTANEAVPAIVGGTLATFADRLPEEDRAAAWSGAYDNYSVLFKQQEPALDKMPAHFRGEVLSGLAQAAQRTGRAGEASQRIDQMLVMLQNTRYESLARQWKSDPSAATASNLTCKTCHEPGRLSPTLERLNKP